MLELVRYIHSKKAEDILGSKIVDYKKKQKMEEKA